MSERPSGPDEREKSKNSILNELTIRDFLAWKHGEVRAPRSLLYVTTEQTLSEAMAMLTSNNVLSVPLWNPARAEWVAFLSVVDVLRYCMGDRERTPPHGSRLMADTLELVASELENDEGAYLDILAQDEKLSKTIQMFTLGVHRILVEDANAASNTPSGFVVSQSDIVQYLHTHESQSPVMFSKSLVELGYLEKDRPTIGPKKLGAISSDTIALDAFAKLYSDRTSAIAIVDSENTLMENLSVSDLRGIREEESEQIMLMPVLDFLAQRRESKSGPLQCQPSDTLQHVVDLLCENRVHRVWVVDADRKLLGIITLTDILCKFAPFDYKLLHSNKV